MKKTKILVALLFMILTACTGETENSNIEKLPETLGQAMEMENVGFSYNDEYFQIETEDMVFMSNIDESIYKELESVDFFSPERDEKFANILAKVKIEKYIKKEDLKLTDEQMKSYEGKKAQVLLDEGFTYAGSYIDSKESKFFLEKDYHTYTITIEEAIEPVDDFTEENYLSWVTIREMEYGINY